MNQLKTLWWWQWCYCGFITHEQVAFKAADLNKGIAGGCACGQLLQFFEFLRL